MISKLLPLALVLAVVLSSIAPAIAYVPTYAETPDASKLLVKARLLQYMLRNIIAIADLPEDIKSRALELVSMDLSKLSIDELKQFVEEASKILSLARERLRAERIMSVKAIATSIADILEKKIIRFANESFISREELFEIMKKLRSVNDLRSLSMIMRRIRERVIEPVAAGFLGKNFWRFMEHAMARFKERAAPEALELAYNASSKVLEVLQRVLERLEKVNASPRAIEAVKLAMARIANAREVLLEVQSLVATLPMKGNETRKVVEEIVEEWIKKRVGKVVDAIDRYIERLKKVREIAVLCNRTDVVEKIDEVLKLFEELRKEIASGNVTVSECLEMCSKLGAELSLLEELVEDLFATCSIAKEHAKGVVGELSEAVEELLGRIASVSEEAEKALEIAQEIGYGRASRLATKLANKSLELLEIAKELINKVVNETGLSDVEKIRLINRARHLVEKAEDLALRALELVEIIVPYNQSAIAKLNISLEDLKSFAEKLNETLEDLLEIINATNATELMEIKKTVLEILEKVEEALKALNEGNVTRAIEIFGSLRMVWREAVSDVKQIRNVVKEIVESMIRDLWEIKHRHMKMYRDLDKVLHEILEEIEAMMNASTIDISKLREIVKQLHETHKRVRKTISIDLAIELIEKLIKRLERKLSEISKRLSELEQEAMSRSDENAKRALQLIHKAEALIDREGANLAKLKSLLVQFFVGEISFKDLENFANMTYQLFIQIEDMVEQIEELLKSSGSYGGRASSGSSGGEPGKGRGSGH